MQNTRIGTRKDSWLDRPLLALMSLDWEKALYTLFFALAVLSRLWDLGVRVMSHDETVHIQWSWYLFRGQGYAHTPLSHGPFLFHATALSYYLFGDSDFSARLTVAILGIVLVLLPYTLRRWLGRGGALVASFLFLISPSLLYYSRYIRHDIPVIVWFLISLVAVFRYLEQGRHPESSQGPHSELTPGQSPEVVYRDRSGFRERTPWLVVLAASLSLMFATKEVAFIYVAITGLFLVLLFLVRLGAPSWKDAAWEIWSKRLLWIATGLLLISALAIGLSGFVDDTSSSETARAVPSIDEALAAEPASGSTGSAVSDFLGLIARWGAVSALGVLIAYVGLLALGSPSHRRIVLSIVGVVTVIAVAVGLLLFSLNLVELFPIQFRECGQAPVPGTQPGQMSCTETDCKLIQGRCQRPIPVIAGDNVAEFDETGTRIAIQLSRPEMLIVGLLISIITVSTGGSAYAVLKRHTPFQAGERPAWDLILVIGSFTFAFLSPFAINGLSGIVSRLFFDINASFSALDYSEAGLLRSAGFVFIFLAVAIAAGLWWDWRRWLPAAMVFWVIFVVLFTTVFTNGNGLASGSVGSLSYWLEQQDVERGGQPWYYYALLVPLYEFLPLLGFFAAVLYVLFRGFKNRLGEKIDQSPASKDESQLSSQGQSTTPAPLSLEATFVVFLLMWTLLTWLAYSAAGEKMPWLTTHFAVPLALTTAWVVGKLISGVDWRSTLQRGGWILALIAPVSLAALVQTFSPWLTAPASSRPFSGYGLGQLNTTMQFLSALLVLSASVGIMYWVWKRIGTSGFGRTLGLLAFGVLAVLTIRTAWIFSFVNYDYASEFLVYAHSTPDVREVMEQIEDISRRTSGDLSLDIGYTADGSYPFIWYLRNYPNATQLPNPPSRPDLDKSVIIAGDKEWSGIEPYLGENYVCNQLNFLWWPMQDYFNLTWERIRYALTNPEMRTALWDIIFRRDYRKYEQTTGKTVRLSEWPLRDSFRFCLRRDLITQVWSESAGPVAVLPELPGGAPAFPDYSGLEKAAAAQLVVSTLGAYGNFNGPHDIAIDADGFIYVADSNNHRVVKLSPEGTVADTWDSTWWHGLQSWKPGCLDAADSPLALGDGEFCEPWGVSVGPDNRIYVADTWNHRIQVFTTEGEFLGKVGTFGQSGSAVSSAPAQFYGPRDVAVDGDGYIYITDTGNKRVQVFDSDLEYVRSFGGPGIIEGRLEEPVGLTFGPDGLLYIADTWNNRIQVLTTEGAFVRQWPVVGWDSQSVVNKPYLATDSAGRVYMSDPEGVRLFIFDAEGTPVAVLGGPGTNLFELPTGVVLDSQDQIWISDAASQRLLQLPAVDFGQAEDQP